MVIATLKEIKDNENRVGITPDGVKELKQFGHTVIVERGAGKGASFDDVEYIDAGATIMDHSEEIVEKADIVVKVKEPLPQEYSLLEKMKGKTLYTYFHLSAAQKSLTEVLLKNEITAVAYETVEDEHGKLPLLRPMSEIAGVLAVQYGAQYLQKKYGGRGVSLGFINGAPVSHVVIVGGGVVGATAARTAAGMGAKVSLFELNEERIAHLQESMHLYLGERLYRNLSILKPEKSVFEKTLAECDVLVGAVLVAGTKAPQVVSEEQVKSMQKGSVIVDVSIDQGGCVWGARVTSHSDPIYDIDGKIYCCVANMPGQVARQSTLALTAATLPYLITMANDGVIDSLKASPRFARGLNIYKGMITYRSVAEDLGMIDKHREFAMMN